MVVSGNKWLILLSKISLYLLLVPHASKNFLKVLVFQICAYFFSSFSGCWVISNPVIFWPNKSCQKHLGPRAAAWWKKLTAIFPLPYLLKRESKATKTIQKVLYHIQRRIPPKNDSSSSSTELQNIVKTWIQETTANGLARKGRDYNWRLQINCNQFVWVLVFIFFLYSVLNAYLISTKNKLQSVIRN